MFLLLLYILQLLLFSSIFSIFSSIESGVIAVVFVAFNTLISILFLFVKLKSFVSLNLLRIVLLGFFVRIVLLFLDVYKVISVIHSGMDTEAFHRIAVNNAIQYGVSGEWITLTNYTDVLSYIYMFCNAQRLVGQYLNVLLGVGVIYYILLSCRELRIKSKTTYLVVTIICFFPAAVIFSGILLREAWVEFFIMYSVFYFIKWFKTGNSIYRLISIISVLLASYMHSGVLFMVVGYLMAYVFYDPITNVVKKNITNIAKLVLVVVLFLPFLLAGTMFTDKFNSVQKMEEEAFLERLESNVDAGSTYLTWINLDSKWQLVVFSPLRIFYFLFSPIPLDWRGFNDVVAFLLDSMFYLFLMYTIFKFIKKIEGWKRIFVNFVMIGLFITFFVFAYGTSTAGTAMRHRCKIIGVVLIVFAIARDRKENLFCESVCNELYQLKHTDDVFEMKNYCENDEV